MSGFRRASLRQWAQLLFGLSLYGIAITLMIRSEIGLGPWDMFHQGISRLTGLSVGTASETVGFALLFGLLFVQVRFGWGTIFNIVLIGIVTDQTLPLVPVAPTMAWKLAFYASALIACGLATGAYIGANMGAGPRDSLMLLLSRRTGWPVRRVRTAIELIVLTCGWLMGGSAGLGTLLFAIGIGPAAQWGLSLRAFNLAARDTAGTAPASPVIEANLGAKPVDNPLDAVVQDRLIEIEEQPQRAVRQPQAG